MNKHQKESTASQKKRHLLSDASFDALVELQKEIAQETGWMPSLYKLVNALVNTQTLFYLKEAMLMEVKDRQPKPNL